MAGGKPSILKILVSADTTEAQRQLEDLDAKLQTFGNNGLKWSAITDGAVQLAAALAPVAAAAGLAATGLGAFAVAATPQLSQVAEASKALDAANKASITSATAAANQMKIYEATIAGMPAATVQTATALTSLKDAFKEWSNALAPEVMPIFTKGLQTIQAALPALTPLVEGAARGMSAFMDSIAQIVNGGSLERFTTAIGPSVGADIQNFGDIATNILTGLMAVIQALAPASVTFTAAIAGMSQEFAKWATSGGADSIAQSAQNALPALLSLADAAVKVVSAVAPMTGVTTVLVQAFAAIVNAIPTPVLQILAVTLASVASAIKIVTLMEAAWETVQLALNVALDANPIGAIVLLLASLAAAIIYAYQHSQTFRDIVHDAFNVAKDVISTVVDAIKDLIKYLKEAWDWLGSVADSVGGFFSSINPFSFSAIPGSGSSARGVHALSLARTNVHALTAGPFAGASGDQTPKALQGLIAGFNINVYLDGTRVKGIVQDVVTTSLNADGARLAAGGYA